MTVCSQGSIRLTQVYDKSTWNYQEGGDLSGVAASAPQPRLRDAHSTLRRARPRAQSSIARKITPNLEAAECDERGGGTGQGHQAGGPVGAAATETKAGPPPALPPNIAYDLTLQHPRCVFQLLKQQYSRYTPEMVERITGIPKDQFLKAAELFTSVRKDGDMKKAATIIYAVGWTQHSNGTQMIRTAAMMQLLLGNVGRAGGGMNALRGHSNIQGATDLAGIFDILPGYLKVPNPATDKDFKSYIERSTPKTSKPAPWDSFNYWSNTPKFAVSFLKAMYGDTREERKRLGVPVSAQD